MGVGSGGREPWHPLNFEIFSKKMVVFLVSSEKNKISPLLVPQWKNLGKIP